MACRVVLPMLFSDGSRPLCQGALAGSAVEDVAACDAGGVGSGLLDTRAGRLSTGHDRSAESIGSAIGWSHAR